MNQPFRSTDLNLLTTLHAASLQDIIRRWKKDGLKIGFVPTMGALHDGHLSLVRLALEHTDRCIVSIFVNPTQFAPHEDFEAYPRNVDTDLQKLQHEGVHLAYIPSEQEIYPDGATSIIKAGAAAEGLESNFRPQFFDGVVTVVHRLFEQVRPDIAVFGEKDFQQLQVIKEMVDTQDMNIEVIGGPIIRDEKGLALSSRNHYLSSEELQIARQLNKILRKDLSPEDTEKVLLDAGFDEVDYVAERWNRRLAAARIGKTRLIDNVEI